MDYRFPEEMLEGQKATSGKSVTGSSTERIKIITSLDDVLRAGRCLDSHITEVCGEQNDVLHMDVPIRVCHPGRLWFSSCAR